VNYETPVDIATADGVRYKEVDYVIMYTLELETLQGLGMGVMPQAV